MQTKKIVPGGKEFPAVSAVTMLFSFETGDKHLPHQASLMKSSPFLKSFRDKSVDQVSASVHSVEMKMFAFANVSWAVGSKEPWLDGLASFVRPLDGERLGAQEGVCVCVRACVGGGTEGWVGDCESQAKGLEDKGGGGDS